MIRELYDLTPEERTAHEAVYGNQNQFPPGWREVTDGEIATQSTGAHYTPQMVEFRQMLPNGRLVPGGPAAVSATLYHFHDGTGHAIVYDYWGKRIRWFRFERCVHTWRSVSRPASPRSGLHTDECTKCGYQNSYDTSD